MLHLKCASIFFTLCLMFSIPLYRLLSRSTSRERSRKIPKQFLDLSFLWTSRIKVSDLTSTKLCRLFPEEMRTKREVWKGGWWGAWKMSKRKDCILAALFFFVTIHMKPLHRGVCHVLVICCSEWRKRHWWFAWCGSSSSINITFCSARNSCLPLALPCEPHLDLG